MNIYYYLRWRDNDDFRIAAEIEAIQSDDRRLELIGRYMDIVRMDLRRGSVRKTVPMPFANGFHGAMPSVPNSLLFDCFYYIKNIEESQKNDCFSHTKNKSFLLIDRFRFVFNISIFRTVDPCRWRFRLPELAPTATTTWDWLVQYFEGNPPAFPLARSQITAKVLRRQWPPTTLFRR